MDDDLERALKHIEAALKLIKRRVDKESTDRVMMRVMEDRFMEKILGKKEDEENG